MFNFLKAQWLFLKELKNNPMMIGAIFPSSKALGNTMAQQLPVTTKGLIVELGAGTGAITSVLQQRFPSKQLVIIERSQGMYHYLTKQFPDIRLILGDAVELNSLLVRLNEPVGAIVSSLPLRTFDGSVIDKLQTAVLDCLAIKGLFIQFTYDPRNNATDILPKLKHLYHKKVWCNFPPAKVDVYQKCP